MGEKGNLTDVTDATSQQAVAQRMTSAQDEMSGMHDNAGQISKMTGAVAPILDDDDSTGTATTS